MPYIEAPYKGQIVAQRGKNYYQVIDPTPMEAYGGRYFLIRRINISTMQLFGPEIRTNCLVDPGQKLQAEVTAAEDLLKSLLTFQKFVNSQRE